MTTFTELAETAERRAKKLAERDYENDWGNTQDEVLHSLIERVRTCYECEHVQRCTFEATFHDMLERAVKDMLIVQYRGHSANCWLRRHEDSLSIVDSWSFFQHAKCVDHSDDDNNNGDES